MFSILPTARDVELNQPWNHCERRDENDIPPECRLGQIIPIDDQWNEDIEPDFDSELRRIYLEGSVRFRVKA